MDQLATIAATIVSQLQSPTLAFLMGGMMLAAMGSKLEIPAPVYSFIVTVLLLKVGLGAGMSLREAELSEIAIPALGATAIGIGVVVLGALTLGRKAGINRADAMATVGLFGAVSASTLAAAMAMLGDAGIYYEGFIGALYPFMDVAALVTAIVLAKLSLARQASASATAEGGTITMGGGSGSGSGIGGGDGPNGINTHSIVRSILTDTLRSGAISALLLGMALGLFAKPESVFTSFYEPLFRGLLSLLMLIMGIEAWQRLSEMRKVAHVYLAYGLTAPLIHGAIGFGVGMLAHHLTGFSAGGVVLLAVMAASSSDVSGPPTMRGALPEANPSAYVGSSTGLGTPVAILSIPLWIALAEALI